MRASQIVDVSLTPKDKSSGFITPVIGVDGGVQVDYDRKTGTLFWVEGRKQDEDGNVSENVSKNFKIYSQNLFLGSV